MPIIIAHRGASGYVPEHTLASYALAVLQGADFVEPDLVMTKDGHLVCRHDSLLNLTTDVAAHPDLAERQTTKVVDGISVTGWFTEDLSLEAIKMLRTKERIPDIRPANARFDGQFQVPTLQEVIDLVQALGQATGRPIGVYPETKHPTYFSRLGLAMQQPPVDILRRNGYESRRDRVFIQSFEVGNLKLRRRMTDVPLVQLLRPEGKPYDVEAAGGTLTYEDMASAAGLAEIASYADGVAPEKYHFIIPWPRGVTSTPPTPPGSSPTPTPQALRRIRTPSEPRAVFYPSIFRVARAIPVSEASLRGRLAHFSPLASTACSPTSPTSESGHVTLSLPIPELTDALSTGGDVSGPAIPRRHVSWSQRLGLKGPSWRCST